MTDGYEVYDAVVGEHRPDQQRSVPVVAEIEALLLAHLHTVLPKSLRGKALHSLSPQ